MTIANKALTGISIVWLNNLTIGEINDVMSLITTVIVSVVTIRKILISKTPKTKKRNVRQE